MESYQITIDLIYKYMPDIPEFFPPFGVYSWLAEVS